MRPPHELIRRAEEYRDVLAGQGRNPDHVTTVFRHIQHVLGVCGPQGFTRSGVERALGELIRAGRSLRTAQHYLTSVRAFARWASAEDQGYIERDPTKSIRPFKTSKDPRHVRRALSEEEIGKLLSAAATSSLTLSGLAGPAWAERWHVLIATGLREGTLRQLLAGQFVLEGEQTGVNVAGWQEAKRGRDRFVPIAPDSAARIKLALAGLEPTAVAFPLPDRWAVLRALRVHLSLAGINQWDEVTDRQGVRRRTNVVDVHSLRTTCGRRMARAGVPIKFAQEILGHSTPVLTQNVYSRVTHGEISRAILTLPRLNSPAAGSTEQP